MPRTRPHKITLYLNDEELRHFKRQVEMTGLNQTKVLHSLVMGLDLHPRPCTHHLELIHLAAKIANSMNQVAHMANLTRQVAPETVQQMTETAQTLWLQVRDNW